MTQQERPRQLFVTGATGFIGRVLLRQLLGAGFESIVCLARRPATLDALVAGRDDVRRVQGDVNQPETYVEALAGCDAALHLAAATGAAREADLMRVNMEGTATLLEACRERGVRRFVYVSSIAAGYDDLGDYPYGRSKLESERLVQKSGLETTILRPTIVLGEGSHIGPMLRKLACLPVVPLFAQGRTRVQPVGVGDVARAIVALADGFPCPDAVVELGGPEVVSFRDLLLRIRTACGMGAARTVSIPVGAVRAPLRVAAWVTGGRFPVSVGQLTPLLMDGTAEPNALQRELQPTMTPLATLLAPLGNGA